MTLKRLKSCKTNSERTMKKRHKDAKKKRQNQNNSERPVDALAEKTLMTHSLTDNLKSRDASASKKIPKR